MMSSSASVILLLLAVSSFAEAQDFEAALSPFQIYDEQRSLENERFYRPVDDNPTPTVNAFQQLHLPTDYNDIFFVGERGIASAVNLSNVQDRRMPVSFDMKDNPNPGALPCETVTKDQAEYLCQNYITVIQPIEGNKVIVCGTNGLVPVCYQCTYDESGFELSCPAAADGKAQCDIGDACYYIGDAGLVAHEPLQETAWLYYNDATLGEVIYAGANEDQNQDSVISRVQVTSEGVLDLASVVKTDKDDPDWLNNAEFVGDPIAYEGHVYFFFRETATEYINAGKIVYSRVGRVCKDDTGGGSGSMLDGKWTTFQKAWLNCSTQGVFPFYFNELEDIYQATTEPNENVVYATFSTAETGTTGSAVCVYRMDEMQELFDTGSFKGAETPAELWLPIDTSKVPTPRPGTCGTPHPTSSYTFIKNYPLMDPLVPNSRDYTTYQGYDRDSNSPLALLQGQRIVELVVDKGVKDSNGKPHDMFFLATDDGRIFKMYMANLDDPVVVEEFNLQLDSTVNEEVVTMKLKDKRLYVGTTERVVAVTVQYCDSYEKCYVCMQLQDPYCSFSYASSACQAEVDGSTQIQCLRETRDQKPFECEGEVCLDWPRPMIAYASENETVVSETGLPVILHFTATGPKYSDLSYDFECECVDAGSCSCSESNCTGDLDEQAKYQRLDKVEWVSVTFTAAQWKACDAQITYTAKANGVPETKTTRITLDNSELVAEGQYTQDIIKYDELMAAYKYQVKMWEEAAIKECYPHDVATCAP